MKTIKQPPPPRTGWPAGMLQDDHPGLSKWLASRPGARFLVDAVCAEIKAKKVTVPALHLGAI